MRIEPAAAIVLALALAACAHASSDQSVTLRLVNAGARPLHCRLSYGHWVDRDLGDLPSGAAATLTMKQAPDGALYVMRSDGQRKMMIETIQCAQSGRWMETFGQIDLAPVRSRRARAVEASCAAPAGEGRVSCRLDRIEQGS